MTSRRLRDAVLRPLDDTHAFASTAQRLDAAIRLGVFIPGEQLPPERELAVQLGVSRVNLREAIAALREAGMVQTRRGRGGGTTVISTGRAGQLLDHDQLRHRRAQLVDALNYRRVVEPGAAYLAAGRELTADQRDWLTDSEAAVRSAGPGAESRIADSRLHLALATLSGSPMLIEAVTRVQSSLDALLSHAPDLPGALDHSHQGHQDVIRAVLAGDPLTARAAMEQHCDTTAALLRPLLE
jgi:GntR family transcriptional repressor for pyruvate dehydrogenase complex